jgi:hypothetical protein
MLRKFLLFSLLCAIASSSFTQTRKERITVKGGPEFWDNFSQQMFLYPSFKEGTIEYRNGKIFKRPLNYNRLLGTVQFIGDKHDTLVLASESDVKSVKIDDDVFVFNPFCVQVISGDKIQLLKSEKLEITEPQMVGAFGIPNATSSIDSYNQINTERGTFALSVNEVLLCKRTTSFYINTGGGDLVLASKQNILKASGGKQNEVKKFISSKKFDFDREADLLEVVKFVSGL